MYMKNKVPSTFRGTQCFLNLCSFSIERNCTEFIERGFQGTHSKHHHFSRFLCTLPQEKQLIVNG